MNTILIFILAASFSAPLVHAADSVPASTESVTLALPGALFPPKPPTRASESIDSAGEMTRALAAVVEYLESGQAYYRAYTKGSHTAKENKAFVNFLQEYEKELAFARTTHSRLGSWIEKKSSVRD
ncbi:MAG: hypothetical protein AAB036_09415 [Elusimicrobiota bacterium]